MTATCEPVSPTRRKFLALSGATAAMASLSAWAVNPVEIDIDAVTNTDHATDVLVIGGGMAGLFAAVKAHDAGAATLIVSKGRLGSSGLTPFGKGFFVFDPATESGSIDDFVATVSRSALGTNNPVYTRQMAEHSSARARELRDWGYFTWLGGDHIVEQHLHNLDIMRWVIGQTPVKAMALGGRQARPNHPTYGHIYDHFAVEFEYANGMTMSSQCRQMDKVDSKVDEFIAGTKGTSNCKDWIRVRGGESWRFRDQDVNPYQQEHQDLIDSIRAGKPLNEAQQTAEATLMAIMGRESAYSGQIVEWDQTLNSNKRLGPEKYEFGPLPFPEVAIPGHYQFA